MTVGEGALEVVVDVEAVEALAVVVAAEDSEEVVVVPEAHDRKYLRQQHLFFPMVFVRRHSCAEDFIKSYGLMALTSSSASLSLPTRSRWVFTV